MASSASRMSVCAISAAMVWAGCNGTPVAFIDSGCDAGESDTGLNAGPNPNPCTVDGGTFAILLYDYAWTTPHALAVAEVGQPYSWQVFAGCGVFPYRFSVAGPLPAGLELAVTGIMSGTPTTPTDGGWVFELLAQDSASHMTEAMYSVQVISGAIGIGRSDGG